MSKTWRMTRLGLDEMGKEGGMWSSSRKGQLNFRFTVLTRRVLVAYYNIAPCRSILFPLENFPPIATLIVYFPHLSFPL